MGYYWGYGEVVEVPQEVLSALGDGFEILEKPVEEVKTAEIVAPAKNTMMRKSPTIRTKKVK